MKIKTRFVSLSLSVEEIEEAIRDFLKKNGYELLKPIAIENLKNLFVNSELVLDAQKQTSRIASSEESEISFPGILISRLGSKNNISVFLENVENNYLQKILNDIFNQINEKYRKIISFTFCLDKPSIGMRKSNAEVQKEFNLGDKNGSIILRKAIAEFSTHLKPIFLEGLKNKTLVIKNDDKDREEILNIKLEDAGFSIRTYNCLRVVDVKTINDLIKMGERELLGLRNLGKLGIEEINIFKKIYNII